MAVQRVHVRDTGIYSESVIQSDLADARARALEECSRAVKQSNALTPEMKRRVWGRSFKRHKQVFEASDKDIAEMLAAKAERYSIEWILAAVEQDLVNRLNHFGVRISEPGTAAKELKAFLAKQKSPITYQKHFRVVLAGAPPREIGPVPKGAPPMAERAASALHFLDQLKLALEKNDAKIAAICAYYLAGNYGTVLTTPFEPFVKLGRNRSDGGKKGAKNRWGNRADVYARWQREVDAYRENHPKSSFTAACRAVGRQQNPRVSGRAVQEHVQKKSRR